MYQANQIVKLLEYAQGCPLRGCEGCASAAIKKNGTQNQIFSKLIGNLVFYNLAISNVAIRSTCTYNIKKNLFQPQFFFFKDGGLSTIPTAVSFCILIQEPPLKICNKIVGSNSCKKKKQFDCPIMLNSNYSKYKYQIRQLLYTRLSQRRHSTKLIFRCLT